MQTKGEMLIEIFEARRYDLASRSDRKIMAAMANEAFTVEFNSGKEVGKAIGWEQAKADTGKMLDANFPACP